MRSRLFRFHPTYDVAGSAVKGIRHIWPVISGNNSFLLPPGDHASRCKPGSTLCGGRCSWETEGETNRQFQMEAWDAYSAGAVFGRRWALKHSERVDECPRNWISLARDRGEQECVTHMHPRQTQDGYRR